MEQRNERMLEELLKLPGNGMPIRTSLDFADLH